MPRHDPLTHLATHEVTNQPPDFAGRDLYRTDAPLREALHREGAGWAEDRVAALGAEAGSERVLHWGEQANRNPPELKIFDRYGRRIDEVEFHPAYHALMELAMRHAIHSIAWTEARAGGHVAHAALMYLFTQAEAGVMCPISMTYAAVPALRHQPDLAAQWVPKALGTRYDPQLRPLAQKNSATLGMAMTEKQGGSDVRANTTRAFKLDGGAYRLVGHKWFCSAPMSDAFLTLAYADRGLSCFLVPRITPDGRRNRFHIQRLKDKLGNRSNASSEIEYHDTWAVMVGEEGRGVPTIIDMVHHTRLDCTIGAAGTMRMALVQALHHTRHRRAFQKTLVDQPLMRAVLADLALESEAGMALTLRIARAFDESGTDPDARLFARLAVAVGKYWLNKRLPNFVYECMECHGGVGYVEESPMPRLYREAPLNSIWEGSGNVICLDILRTLQKEPRAADAFFAELDQARGGNAALDRAVDELKDERAHLAASEASARLLAERLALTLQGALLVRHAPSFVADAFCATRLGGTWGRGYGTLPPDIDAAAIIDRAASPD